MPSFSLSSYDMETCQEAELLRGLQRNQYNSTNSNPYISYSLDFSNLFSTTTLVFLITFVYLFQIIYSFVFKLQGSLLQFFLDGLTTSVQISGAIINDKTEHTLYHELIHWLALKYPNTPSKTAACTYSQIGNFGKKAINSAPGFGTHYIKYGSYWIHLERKSTPALLSDNSSSETIILTTWIWNKAILPKLLEEAASDRTSDVDLEDKIYIYRCFGESWRQIGGGKTKRLKESVILDDGISERIFKDASDFIQAGEWYASRDIPYRRGYLFFGPPGCGKTSFVKALAGHIGFNICVLPMSSKGLTDDGLSNLLENAPANSIILMEDIDAAFKSREDRDATSSETNLAFEGRSPNALTFRGLLNALDGVASNDSGLIICMTTNYVEKLDPALIRCGRVDQKVLINYPNHNQVKRLFKRFYPEASPGITEEFIDIVHDLNNVSVAMIQGLFLVYKDNVEDTVKNSRQFFKDEFSIGDLKSQLSVNGANLYS